MRYGHLITHADGVEEDERSGQLVQAIPLLPLADALAHHSHFAALNDGENVEAWLDDVKIHCKSIRYYNQWLEYKIKKRKKKKQGK